MAETEWHGTVEEGKALDAALKLHCTCTFNQMTGERLTTCPPHKLILEDQRALDGLLFCLHIAAALQAEEDKP